jgi:addiction module RelE/StbE family toxin
MARIIWTLQAIEDLENIYNYISKDSEKYARIQIVRIRERTRMLKKFPRSGKNVPETGNTNICEILSGNYRIIYRLKNEQIVEILTIHHSARNLSID